jgi:hypothetical protein
VRRPPLPGEVVLVVRGDVLDGDPCAPTPPASGGASPNGAAQVSAGITHGTRARLQPCARPRWSPSRRSRLRQSGPWNARASTWSELSVSARRPAARDIQTLVAALTGAPTGFGTTRIMQAPRPMRSDQHHSRRLNGRPEEQDESGLPWGFLDEARKSLEDIRGRLGSSLGPLGPGRGPGHRHLRRSCPRSATAGLGGKPWQPAHLRGLTGPAQNAQT